MPLLVDTACAARRLDPDAFARWAATHTVFLSSEMRELGELRRTVVLALRDGGSSGVVFEARDWAVADARFVPGERRRGKRISAWLQSDASGRQGDAANFAQVRAFHTTGGPLGQRAGVAAYYGDVGFCRDGGGGGGLPSTDLAVRIRGRWHDNQGPTAVFENALDIVRAYLGRGSERRAA